MAPVYKIIYFDGAGFGEPIRVLLTYGGIEFEDNRVSVNDWPAIKDSMPFGQMPILEHNGKRSHQSIAIARYIAKQVKLVGKDDWEDLEIDATVDTVNDLILKVAKYYYEKEESVKESLKGPLFNEILPYYLKRLDAQAKKNGGYLAVERFTWADVFFVSLLKYFNYMVGHQLIKDYPNLKAVENHVLENEKIKTWFDKYPKI